MKTYVKHPAWSKNISMYEVNVRQFTENGTFKEFEEHLPRIKELGVGVIWFMPIQPIGKKKRKGSLGSYYSIQNFTAVNPEYGTLEEFKALVKKIHDMGMYVILDWVTNHTAWDNVWRDQHPDFYSKNENGDFISPTPEWTDVLHLNYENKQLWETMIDAMKFWITEVDIDGFRCDMAHLVSTKFWNETRRELDKVKKVFMLAESENRDLLEKAFDMEYNWNLFHLTNEIAQRKKNVFDLDNILQHEIIDYPQDSYQLMFTSNHDENSWNGSAIERLGVALETINVLMFTIDGMPLIYSGQEVGEYRRLKFFDKDQIYWKEDKMTPFYQILNKLKKNNKALWNGNEGGDFVRINASNKADIFAFIRQKDENKVFVILNLSHYLQNTTLFGDNYIGEYKNVFTNLTENYSENSFLSLAPWEYKVLITNKHDQ